MIKKKEGKMKKEILPNVCESTQCKFCDKNCIWKPQSYTNADKIRALTDEELARWIALRVPCLWCPAKSQEGKCKQKFDPKISCTEAVFDWLKQEV